MTSVSKALVKASEGPENVFLAKQVRHLRRFIQAYRDMLNQLQLWNVRATFDVTWNQLDKKYPQLVTNTQALQHRAMAGGQGLHPMMAMGRGGNPGGMRAPNSAQFSQSISDREQHVSTNTN